MAVPTLVDFKDDGNENVNVFVKRVECGNTFTVCMMGTYFQAQACKFARGNYI